MSRHFSPEEVIAELASDVRDERFIGTYLPFEPWESVSFGITYAGGYSTVIAWPPTSHAVGGPWLLHIAAAIAYQVSDIDGALRWANAKNRSEDIGRYLVAEPEPEDLNSHGAAVVYHMAVRSTLIDSDAPEIWVWMTRLLTHAARTAATESQEFIKAHGGSQVGESFIAALGTIALSPG